jgi:hypothetical protein
LSNATQGGVLLTVAHTTSTSGSFGTSGANSILLPLCRLPMAKH